MRWVELADTLTALIDAVRAPEGSGLIVEEATLDVPLEIQGAIENGKLVFLATPPHTRWKSGVLPPTHLSRLSIALAPAHE